MSTFNNTMFDGEVSDLEFSDVGGGFIKSIKKTYSRRSDAEAPKTFGDKLKRAGSFIPLVALTKAAIDSKKQSNTQSVKQQSSLPKRRPKSSPKSPTGLKEVKNSLPRYSRPKRRPTMKPILVKKPNSEEKGFWSKSSKGVKAGIIGGGVLILGAITYFIIKSKK